MTLIRDLTDAQLTPFMNALRRFTGLAYAGALDSDGWRELAFVLYEECQDVDHAALVVDRFLRAERLDAEGRPLKGIPEPYELRVFARSAAVISGPLPARCDEAGCRADDREGCWIASGDAVRRCDCARGQALAAMDLARAGRGSNERDPIARSNLGKRDSPRPSR
jgi:hypothetical protein